MIGALITAGMTISGGAAILALIAWRHDGPTCQCFKCQAHRGRQ